MKNLNAIKSSYQDVLESYYTSLKVPQNNAKKPSECTFLGLAGDLIWSSAVLAVVDELPHGLREKRFVEIVLNNEKEIANGRRYLRAA